MCLVHGSLYWMGLPCPPPTLAPDEAHSKSGGLAWRSPAPWRTPGCSFRSSPTPPCRPSWHSPFLLPAHVGRLGLPDSGLPPPSLHRPPPHWSCILLACYHCPRLYWGGCLPAPQGHPGRTFPGVILFPVIVHQCNGWFVTMPVTDTCTQNPGDGGDWFGGDGRRRHSSLLAKAGHHGSPLAIFLCLSPLAPAPLPCLAAGKGEGGGGKEGACLAEGFATRRR